MSDADAYKAFGNALRRLRRRAGLTLQQAADLSRQVAEDPKGYISQPYLAQTEGGRRGPLSFMKLATLAAMYGVPYPELWTMLPDSVYQRLERQRRTAAAEGRMLPDPTRRYMLGSREEDENFYRTAVLKVTGGSIPIGQESAARQVVLSFLTKSCIPPFIERAPARLFADFASFHPNLGADAPRDPLGRRHAPTSDAELLSEISDLFELFVRYRVATGGKLLEFVSRWSLDFMRELVCCHFADADLEERYGYDNAPLVVLEAVRAAQALCTVTARLSENFPDIPAPKRPAASGVDAYLDVLLNGYRPVGNMRLPCAAATLQASRDIAQRIPQLAMPEYALVVMRGAS